MKFLREVICSKCDSMILRKSHDGMWRFSSKVIKSNEDGSGVIAVCKKCGNEEPMPVRISMSPIDECLVKSNKPFTIKDKKKP
jgi:RNase P subunit RPR2